MTDIDDLVKEMCKDPEFAKFYQDEVDKLASLSTEELLAMLSVEDITYKLLGAPNENV